MALPGIGEINANAIIEYRKHTEFKSIDEMKNIKGISNKRFNVIKADLATTGNTDINSIKSKANIKDKESKISNKDTVKNANKTKSRTKSEKNSREL